jgi:hypothetical protein
VVRRAVLKLLAALLAAGSGGCVIIDVGVTNPIPGLSTVAIAPFFNQSAERAVDGRQFALAYYTELQKVPGFQVVPVGVTEIAIREHNLNLSSPDDVLKLARILGVDAVVVGAITDYDPYYPPRIGLAVDWYSPFPWTFYPGLPTEPELREDLRQGRLDPPQHDHADPADPDWEPEDENRWYRRLWRQIKTPQIIRGQSDADTDGPQPASDESGWRPTGQVQPPKPAAPVANGAVAGDPPAAATTEQTTAPEPLPVPPEPLPAASGPPPAPPELWSAPEAAPLLRIPAEPCPPVPFESPSPPMAMPPVVRIGSATPFDARLPLMSYTRLFDGADAELTARLRDYLELRSDLRTGSWPAMLRRSDEFIRFTSHLMISEMLALHGGEGRRRVVFKFREH